MIINTTTAYAFGSATVSTTALDLSDFGFSAAEIDDAQIALITCDTNAVRFRYDGTAPTAGAGMYLKAEGLWLIEGNANIVNLQFIRAGGSDGVVAITLEN